jgi:arginine transport system substrate-binding protein
VKTLRNFCFVLVAIAALSTSACSKSCAGQKTSDANEKRVLVVGTNATYPPYEMVNSKGEVVGFDMDVAQAIGNELGMRIEVREMGFDALILALKQGKIDIAMAGISITEPRQKEISLIPYQGSPVKSYALLFWDKIPSGVYKYTDLKNVTVCVQSGTVMEQFVSSVKDWTSKALDATPELVMDIQYGKSAAALMEPHIATEILGKYTQLRKLDITLPRDQWVLGNGIGIKKENKSLYDAVLGAVIKLKNDGTLQKLEQKWFKGVT